MSDRMTAERLAAQFDKSADWHRNFGTCAAAMIYRDAAAQIREHLTPQWRLPTDDMPDGWYWIEGRDDPHVLTRLRDGSWRCEKIVDAIDGPFVMAMQLGACRVAPCTGRPE